MLIVCPSCATAYNVEPASLQPDGRNVRCARCHTVWRAELSQPDRLIAAAAALAPQLGPAEFPAEAAAEQTAVPSFAFAEAGSSPGADQGSDLPDAPAETDRTGLNSHAASTAEVPVDAPESVEVEAPPIAPTDLDEGRPPIDVNADRVAGQFGEHPENPEVVAARRRRRKAMGGWHFWALSPLQVAILVLIILDAILVGWRKDIVRLLPQTASLYAAIGMPVNLRGLSFVDVTTNTQTFENVPILVVRGKIVNDTGADIAVPRLKLLLRNAAKQEIYSWTAAAPQTSLSPYQTVDFLARLASPPPGTSDVLVRFLDRRDLLAPGR